MREQRFDLEGTSLFARCWGGDAGPVVVLWHGLGLRASMVFNELVGTLARRVPDRFVAIDAPGFGRSPALRSDVYRTQTLVDLSVKVFRPSLLRGRAVAGLVMGCWAGLPCGRAASESGNRSGAARRWLPRRPATAGPQLGGIPVRSPTRMGGGVRNLVAANHCSPAGPESPLVTGHRGSVAQWVA